ncbi:MAG: replication initiator protein A [Bacteroidota bacterium]
MQQSLELKPVKPTLAPERHPTKDFFIADIFDNLPLKDDIASMEHPIFSLSKNRDVRTLEYTNGTSTLRIAPSVLGLPTIFDKDVLLYCASLLMDAINRGNTPKRTLRISSHDLLVATNRPTNGKGYGLLKKALDRLQGVSIKTNIKTDKREITSAFGLIDSYEIIESSRVKNRMLRLEITLSEWFFNSIIGKEVLTISRRYFWLGKALERRLYEIARKHCGKQESWSISLTKLKEKTGSTSSLKKFRYFIRQIEKDDHLPDYWLRLNEQDKVEFGLLRPVMKLKDLPSIKPETLQKVRQMVEQSGTAWSFDNLHTQFSYELMNGFNPEKADGAFVNFVKKKLRERP